MSHQKVGYVTTANTALCEVRTNVDSVFRVFNLKWHEY